MTPESLADRLLRTFLAELDDQLAVLNRELLALEEEEGARDEHLMAIFRVAHTLKGAARVANVPLAESVCHAMESLLDDVRAGRRALDAPLFALLFAAVDALGDAGRRLGAGEPLDDSPLATLDRQLAGGFVGSLGQASGPVTDAMAQERTAASTDAQAVPSAPPIPIAAPRAEPAEPAEQRRAPSPTATTAAGAPAAGEPRAATAADIVRVEATRLDQLVVDTGQLAVTVARTMGKREELEGLAATASRWVARWQHAAPRLRQALARSNAAGELHDVLESLDDELRGMAAELRALALATRRDERALQRVSEELSSTAHRLSLRPVSEATAGLPRLVRDVAAQTGKEAELQLVGGDVEVDRLVLDGVREALLHLVRNAVDHGLETPAERQRAGKPPVGTVRVRSELRGAQLHLTVADDGRGLDVAAVREQLERRGITPPADARELVHVLFEGGFSTRREATTISGRGVGLDVVKAAMEHVRGTVDVRWTPGAGTTFVLVTPLSLATQRALLVRLGAQPIAVPSTAVRRLLRVPPDALRQGEGRMLLPMADGPVAVASLARLLGPPLAEPPAGARLTLLLLAVGLRELAVRVDEAVAEMELVVHPLPRRMGDLPHLAGAALLPDGQVALMVNPAVVVHRGLRDGGGPAPAAPARAAPIAARVLVVDDSITTRTLEQSVLEAAGYDVVTAVDGEDGWRLLQERGAELVLSDVEMPRLDGFALCERIRASKRFAQLPVVLVTSLEAPEHRARGLEAGADAYVVKSEFDQEALLATVRELLGREGA